MVLAIILSLVVVTVTWMLVDHFHLVPFEGELMGQRTNLHDDFNKEEIEKELKIVKARQHIIEGLIIAHRNWNEVQKIIQYSDNPKNELMEKYSFSDYQAQSILDLKKPLDEIEESKILGEQENLSRQRKRLENISAHK